MQNTKATETEREITRMVKARGLDPAVWCWVGVDGDGECYAFNYEPLYEKDHSIKGYYNPNGVGYNHAYYVGTILTTEPQLFKFNPFYDNEEQN
jgi:hypothetical protein